jgi:hypothetical protein
MMGPEFLPHLEAEAAALQAALQSETLDLERLQVAAICGHPASRALWQRLGHATGDRSGKRRASDLIQRLFVLAPAWGLAGGREALRQVLHWLAAAVSDRGRRGADVLLQALLDAGHQPERIQAAWQALPYAGVDGEPFWALEKAAVLLWRATLTGTADQAIACVGQGLQGLQDAHFPIRDTAEGDTELGWAIVERLAAEALGYQPRSWRRPLGKASRWRIWEEAGDSHGDLYELERTTYFRVLDWQTKTVIATYSEEMSASYDGVSWADYTYGGVKAITVSPTGLLLVHQWSGDVIRVDPLRLGT